MAAYVQIEIVTPSELFFQGEGESLVCTTTDGEEGFLKGHSWCCKLLGETGKVRIRTKDGELKTARIKGGYVDIKDKFIVFSDEAEWL
ncbi:MAG: hypothetical protein PUB87_08400 [Eubacteriaceae bacterium]|nr:hypothetical protein [Eubacteriaceae bacterium]